MKDYGCSEYIGLSTCYYFCDSQHIDGFQCSSLRLSHSLFVSAFKRIQNVPFIECFHKWHTKDKKLDWREQAKLVVACGSAIVCHKLFILSPDIDIILQETLPWQLSQKVKYSPPAGHIRGWSKLCYFPAQPVCSINSSLWESEL
ncbi:hypothetical protein GOODEAATRI_004436 [Goodea atripinnis]|uniref:Uncharacterized protein n=1 Tax=Goodea atripinnis TaxID=208336 RepID=A0ABV0PBD2_9TELE